MNTKEDKELLLKDLCARLPYGVFMTNKKLRKTFYPLTCDDLKDAMFDDDWDDIPYLRSMSSMTDEERKEYKHLIAFSGSPNGAANLVDWLNNKMFAYHTIGGKDMFELGIALKAPKGMY